MSVLYCTLAYLCFRLGQIQSGLVGLREEFQQRIVAGD